MTSSRSSYVLGALVALAGLSSSVHAQQFQRYLGSDKTEELTDIKPVVDANNVFQGYIACGWRDFADTSGNLDRDFWIVRLAASGNVIWSVHYGSPTNPEEATSVTQTPDGGFAIVGEMKNLPGSSLGLGILKLDPAGTFVWSRVMTGGGFAERIAVQQARTPGATVVTAANGDVALVSYYRPSPATSLAQHGVFYRWNNAGVLQAARTYIDNSSQITQISLTDLRELTFTQGDFGVVGTTLSPYQIIPGGPVSYDINPLYMRTSATGLPVGAAAYPTFGANNRRAVETGDGMTLLPLSTSVVLSGFTDYAVPGPVTITGTHMIKVNALTGAPTGMTRYHNFFNGYAAMTTDRATGDVVVAGAIQNLTTVSVPVIASLLRVDSGTGALVWNRGYFHAGGNSTTASGVAASNEPSRPFAIVGAGFPAGPYGSFDAFFVRSNNFGLTGCKEVLNEPAVTAETTTALVVPMISTTPDTSGWQATWARVGTREDFVCQGTGCCNLADITGIGGDTPCDGQLTVDDVILFFNSFSDATGCPGSAPCNPADVTSIGGPPALADGQLTVDDIIAFVNAFSDGCV